MKTILKITLIAALLCVGCSTAASAQKFGYVNTDDIIMSMPEIQEVDANLSKLRNDHVEQLELLSVEFNNKYEEFNKNATTYTDAIKQIKSKELQEINNRIQEYEQIAYEDLQKAQSDMLAPIYEKARNAIEKVGIDNGFTMIFDLASGALTYADKNNTTDVTSLVKRELGIVE